jgi:hypothetical protein
MVFLFIAESIGYNEYPNMMENRLANIRLYKWMECAIVLGFVYTRPKASSRGF